MYQTIKALLVVIALAPSMVFADDNKMLDWTKNVIIQTLSVNYETMQKQLKASKPNYNPSAWKALNSFFGDKVPTIQNQQLTLHPEITGALSIVDNGQISNVTYWRVKVPVSIPELKSDVVFLLTIIKNGNPPYLIQSLNVIPPGGL